VGIIRKIYSFLLDSVQTFLIAFSVFLVIYVFLFRPFEVKGDSMYPNFVDQEYVLTNIISLRFSHPQRGDVIVFKSPSEPDKDFIKRVIGVQGDTIMLKNGDVYLNGNLLDESAYLKPDVKTYGGSFLKDGQTITVPPGQYFVMGDNRIYSSDSREWGFVKQDEVIGKSFFVYWPLSKLGFIKNPY
jgi:signal peptidase I